ncbi:MAG: glutathione S-transferase [Rhodospirillales bacterium]|nr:glutathione S-transferase [Rhodospirillales bacterium]
MSLTLIIGTKTWSSWSLRPWVAMKEAKLPFKEIVIHLRQTDTRARILEYCPAGKVPILIDGRDMIWESLAILDYLAARFPEAKLWPHDFAALACARSVSAEMHSGFPDLRRELPMDIGADLPTPTLSPAATADVERVQAIWRDARSRFGGAGHFLFGRFSNADAMYAPVVTRFRTYNIPVDPVCAAYMLAVLSLHSMTEWYRAADEEQIE